MDTTETKLIKGEDGGALRINASDFDARPVAEGGKGHEEYTPTKADVKDGILNPVDSVSSVTIPADGVKVPPAPAAPASINPVAPTTQLPGEFFTKTIGKKTFVVDANGTIIQDERFDPKGYDVEKGAWDAIIAATPH